MRVRHVRVNANGFGTTGRLARSQRQVDNSGRDVAPLTSWTDCGYRCNRTSAAVSCRPSSRNPSVLVAGVPLLLLALLAELSCSSSSSSSTSSSSSLLVLLVRLAGNVERIAIPMIPMIHFHCTRAASIIMLLIRTEAAAAAASCLSSGARCRERDSAALLSNTFQP